MAKTNPVLPSEDSHPVLCRADAPPAAGGEEKGGLRRRRSRLKRYFDVFIMVNECPWRRRKADRPEERRVLARSTGVSAHRSRSAPRGPRSREAREGLAADPAPWKRRMKEGVQDQGMPPKFWVPHDADVGTLNRHQSLHLWTPPLFRPTSRHPGIKKPPGRGTNRRLAAVSETAGVQVERLRGWIGGD